VSFFYATEKRVIMSSIEYVKQIGTNLEVL
jgi:hypothetical protein